MMLKCLEFTFDSFLVWEEVVYKSLKILKPSIRQCFSAISAPLREILTFQRDSRLILQFGVTLFERIQPDP